MAGGRGVRVLAVGVALVVTACGQLHDLATQRCLEVLAYHTPHHGEVRETATAMNSDVQAVTIHYVAAGPSASKSLQNITCEFSEDEHWTFARITIGGRELSETQLALVNAELLLRDLSLRPQRFEERSRQSSKVEGGLPSGAGAIGDGHPLMLPRSEPSRA